MVLVERRTVESRVAAFPEVLSVVDIGSLL